MTIHLTRHRSGKALIRLYNDYQSAEVEVAQLLLKVKSIWDRTESQMAFLKKIWDSLDPNFQTNQILLLAQLENQLQRSTKLLNSIIGVHSEPTGLRNLLAKKGVLRRKTYAVSVKDSLTETLSDILEWRELFDPSWYLLSRVADSSIDLCLKSQPRGESLRLLEGLRKSVRDLNVDNTDVPTRPISARDFVGARTPIASSTLSIALIEGRNQYGIVDTMPVNSSMDKIGTMRSVIALSKVLSRMDPATFGLLRCCGVINKSEKYEFVFEVPQELDCPRSLRGWLHDSEPSLNVKLELAKQLAKSVFYVHAAGFVHKNIRPETILVFDRGSGRHSLYLSGFEKFRATKDETFYIGDSLPERELYRHPLRQGNNPGRRYVMQHDIYSLGVCLLEIGLWRSFVRIENNITVTEFAQDGDSDSALKSAFAIKQQIMLTANEQLAQRTGARFKVIAEECLTCLDRDATWNRDDNKEPEVAVGIEFIENILLQLSEIVV